jgi:hypothetical protein
MQLVPRIYCHSVPTPRLGWLGRSVAGLLAVMSLAVLIIAVRLNPDSRGIGTHEQLGLAPCGMLDRLGVPCPTCGMTTSFALLLDGRLGASLTNQPSGTLLAFITACAVWVFGYVACTGLPAARWFDRFPTLGQVVLFVVLMLGGWVWKIISITTSR